MHKISNFTGQARHGWERMTPTFGMSRPHTDMAFRRPHGAPPMTPPTSIDPTVNLSFNIPFSSTLSGPDVEDVIHASPGALERWTFPQGTPEGTPVHQLPVHTNNVEGLRRLCRQITEGSGGRIEASLTFTEPKAVPSLQRRPNGLVTNVCVTGDGETVRKMRAKILNETPIMLVRGLIFPVQTSGPSGASTGGHPLLTPYQLLAMCDRRCGHAFDYGWIAQGHSSERPRAYGHLGRLHRCRHLPADAQTS